MLTLALLLSLTQPASAAETCPWPKVEDASASMSTVYVNGRSYFVRGGRNWREFEQTLNDCGEGEAARHLRAWRANRRVTNATAIVGLLVFWPALIVTPVTAILAGGQKDAMLDELEH